MMTKKLKYVLFAIFSSILILLAVPSCSEKSKEEPLRKGDAAKEVADQEKQESAKKEKQDVILRELRKMESATSVGVNIRSYRERLIDLKASTEYLIEELPSGEFQRAVKKAVICYEIGSVIWGYKMSDRKKMTDDDLKAIKDLGVDVRSYHDEGDVLNALWQKATEMREEASLIKEIEGY